MELSIRTTKFLLGSYNSKQGVFMKLKFPNNKPNTTTVQFRIDPDTKKMMNALKKHYKVGTGALLKQMIIQCHESAHADMYGTGREW